MFFHSQQYLIACISLSPGRALQGSNVLLLSTMALSTIRQLLITTEIHATGKHEGIFWPSWPFLCHKHHRWAGILTASASKASSSCMKALCHKQVICSLIRIYIQTPGGNQEKHQQFMVLGSSLDSPDPQLARIFLIPGIRVLLESR